MFLRVRGHDSRSLTQAAEAEQINGDVYRAAQPDALKDAAARLVTMYNSERQDEVLRLAASEINVSLDQV